MNATLPITVCEVTFIAVGLHTLKLQIGKIFTKDQ